MTGKAGSLLFWIGLTCWVGGMAALGLIVAPALFRQLPRDQAGASFGEILRRFSFVEMGCAAAVVTGSLLLLRPRWVEVARLTLAGLMAAVMLLYTFGVNREMHDLRPRIEHEPEIKERFDLLHKRSELLFKANFLLGAALLLLGGLTARTGHEP